MWMAKHLPDAVAVAANSTAEAAQQVAASSKGGRATGMASIGTRQGAANAGLEILASEIEDHPENQTRFVLVGFGVPAPTGHDKTSVVCFQRQDRPGSLLAILQEFAARAINITKLESRPTKRDLGDYCFFIDFEGHLDDELVADCLRNLAAKQAKVKFLGSYPVAAPDGHTRRKAVTKAWRDANAWLAGLREQIRREDDRA
jgi:prephenate dehydratase